MSAKTQPSAQVQQAQASSGASYGAEVNQFHSRLLRVSLALEESRAYWEQMTLETAKIPRSKQAEIAFEGRWFGSKSLARVQRLLGEFGHRYEAYPAALEVLLAWQPNDLATRQNICHWHLQLADPMYRAFSDAFLAQRRSRSSVQIDRDMVARWVSQNLTTQWASATVLRMATALITCVSAAGLCDRTLGIRTLTYPKVTDAALAYWLYFLRDLRFEGTMLSNPYFASVGLSNVFLEQRLRQLPGVGFSRMAELHEFDWQYADIRQWAAGELGLAGLVVRKPTATAAKETSR